MQKFDVLLSIKADKLSTFLTAIEGSVEIIEIKGSRGEARIGYANREPSTTVMPMQAGQKPAPGMRRYANGKRDKGITGADLVMEILSKEKRAWSYNEIAQEFVNRGFARNSASPVLWGLTNTKKVRFLGDAKYALPGTVITMGAAHKAT